MKHGDASRGKSKEYLVWVMMKQRCLNDNHPQWEDYGGRGITICKRWLDKKHGYANFLNDVGRAPTNRHTIDRMNNDKGYKPSNVKWSTRQEQALNRRASLSKYTGNLRLNFAKISASLGGRPNLVTHRLERGWSIERAISTPAHR